MIIRIVRMEFTPEKADIFLALFNSTKSQIRHFPGVMPLHLSSSCFPAFLIQLCWCD